MGPMGIHMVLVAMVVAMAAVTEAFYLPGVPHKSFIDKESEVDVAVMKLTSTQNMLPYEYYDLPFCYKDEDVEEHSSNLGEILSGTRKKDSMYQVTFGVNAYCEVLKCSKATETFDQNAADLFTSRIKQGYIAHMMADNLPAVRPYSLKDDPETELYDLGYPIGFHGGSGDHGHQGVNADHTYIFNHLHIRFLYHVETEAVEVAGQTPPRVLVGFEVIPKSMEHKRDPSGKQPLLSCSPTGEVDESVGPQRIDAPTKVIWTYDVVFEESDIKWSERWNRYLQMSGPSSIHWFSILTSLVIALVLTGMVALILLRTLHSDMARYRELLDDPEEKALEETGWKLLHGDVFRPPRHPLAFAVMMGSGTQMVAICAIVLIFSVLGFLSPAIRGGLLTTTIILFEFLSALAGYVTSRVYKQFACTDWKRATVTVAFAFPGLVFGTFFVVDMAVWSEASSAAVPFSTMLLLCFLWFCISVPLVFLGAYMGFKAPVAEVGETNHFPRLVPEQPWYMRGVAVALMAGVLPFGAVFIELNYVLKSLWTSDFYYVFGILFLVFLILLATCAEVSVVMVYFQLSAEDYNWWWRSVLCSGASAAYMFLYSVYFFAQLGVTRFVPTLVYFAYTGLFCTAFFLLTGAVGFFASWKFVRSIYKSVRSD